MPTNLVLGVNTMNCDAITKSAAASQEAPEARALRVQVTNVSLAQNGQGTVRGLSLATLAAALAACGGGGSGGPAAPPPPPPPPPPNNAPTGTDATATAVEDGDPATGSAVGSDEDGDSLTYNVTTDPSHGTLTLADDGSWTYTITDSDEIQALGVGATITDTAEIEISDGEAAATATVTITIEGANDDPTAENGMGMVTAGTDMAAMGNVNAADVDSGDTHTFAVTTDSTYGTLTVDEMGAWTYELDHDDEAVRMLGHGEMMEDGTGTITVTDSNGGTAEVTVSITITGIVEAPEVSAMSADVQENDMSGPNLLEVSSPDTGVTFSVDNDKFEIDTVGSASVLKLKDGMYLDHEGTGGMVTLMITATDAMDNPSMPTAVTINVGDVNEAPMISVMDSETPDGMTAAASIMENAAGVPVGEIMVSDYDMADADLSGMITVSDDRFEVSEDAEGGLWLKLKDGVSLDHETDPMVTVTVGVTDTGTNGMAMSASTDVVVTVGNVNEDPTISVVDSMTPDGMPARSNIPENQAGVPVGEIMISDPDMADAELGEDDITLSGEHAMYFELDTDAEGGIWLKLKEGVSLNYEEMDSVMVTVTVTDSGMATAMDTVTVTVGNVNEPPSISVANPMIAENTTGSVGIVTVTDNEEMRDITLDVEDIRVVGRDDFEVVESKSGDYELRLTKPIDFESDAVMKNDDFTGYVEVVLQVTDEGLNGSDPITTTQPIKVMVVNEDEAPMISVMDGMTPDGMPAVSSIDENSNMDGDVPVGLITASDPENGDYGEADVDITGADADSFTVKEDDDGMLWLMLNMGASADHEGDGGSLNVTLTVSDGTNAPAMTDFTLTLMDVNEAPVGDNDKLMKLEDHDGKADTPLQAMAVGAYEAATAESPYSITLDLTGVFDDQDGDTLFIYTVDGPSWLTIGNPVRGEGNSVSVTLSGAVPAGAVGTHEVMIYATDQGGEMDSVSFNLVVDDGNDRITDIELTNPDGSENVYFEIEVDENEPGVVFGYLSSMDLDDANHPNGAHKTDASKWEVDNDNFEVVPMNGMLALKLVDGKSLDHEKAPDSITITVTDGDKTKFPQRIDLQVNDKNDAPTVKHEPGNWWVTAPEDLEDDEVERPGQWVKFQIEVAGDDKPLFVDEDDGEELTYTLTGPAASFLEIVDGTTIQNKKGVAPKSGTFDVVITASDGGEDGAMSAVADFKITVVLSDEENEDKDQPEISSPDGIDRDEGVPEGTVVARFTVDNEDLHLKGLHPWGDMTVKLTLAQDTTNGTSPVELDLDYFKVERESEGTDSEVWVVKLTKEGAAAMDHEKIEDVRLTVAVWDNIGENNNESNPDDTRTIDFDIENRDEPIVYMRDDGDHSTELVFVARDGSLSFTTDQRTAEQDDDTSSDNTTRIYLNLTKLFGDLDGDDDDDELSFSISENTPWISIYQQAMEWRDIVDSNEDDEDSSNDILWSDILDRPDENSRDIVAILEIDRDGMKGKDNTVYAPEEIEQDVDGSFTITARGEDTADTARFTVTVKVKDENLDIPINDVGVSSAVTISDSTPAQGNRLTVRFDESKDPDFTGDNKEEPVAVLYKWKTDEDTQVNDNEMLESVSVNSPMSFVLSDAHVDMHVLATVVYFELEDGSIVKSEDQNAKHSDMVENRNDAPTGAITLVGTNAGNNVDVDDDTENDDDELVFSSSVKDADDIPDDGEGARTYRWEYSANGRSGWKKFDDNDPDSELTAHIPKDAQGNYVRVVMTYTDDGGDGKTEIVASQAIKVGAIDHTSAGSPSITIARGDVGGSVKPGGQLKIDGATKGAQIEWINNKTGEGIGTGDTLNINNAHAGLTIEARITGVDNKGNVVYITTTDTEIEVVGAAPGPTENSLPSKKMDDIMDAGAAMAEGKLFETMKTFDLSKLFDDVEGGLKYDITMGPDNFDQDDLEDSSAVNVYMDTNDGGDQLIIVDESNPMMVKVNYYSTKGRMHDDNGDDGQGNIVSLTVGAYDEGTPGVDQPEATALIGLRIDVAATGVEEGNVAADKPFEITHTLSEGDKATVTRDPSSGKETDYTGADTLSLNVLDENAMDHAYGSYDWDNAVISDDRFEVVPVAGDGSMATFRLKHGVTIDNTKDDGSDDTVNVTVKVKPMGAIDDEITIKVVVTVVDTAAGNTTPTPNDIPGLKDNEPDEDDTMDGDDDGEDGGSEDDGGIAAMSAMLDDGLF